MKKITGLMLLMLSVLMASCTAQAKSDKTDKLETPKAESAEVINLTKADFISKVFDYQKNSTVWKYEGNKPCIVDFYADWCGPCKKVAPILKELAQEYDGKLVIYKINVDKEKELATVFDIQSIPTLLFIPVNGAPQVAQGALSKEQFQQTINDFLLKTKE
jgi:thioredoxin